MLDPSYLHDQNKSVYTEKETTIERSVNGNLINLSIVKKLTNLLYLSQVFY